MRKLDDAAMDRIIAAAGCEPITSREELRRDLESAGSLYEIMSTATELRSMLNDKEVQSHLKRNGLDEKALRVVLYCLDQLSQGMAPERLMIMPRQDRRD
jgi:hypothetical protein